MRKTKIIGFSIPPEIYTQFESVLKDRHRTKSEFFREILDIYFKNADRHVEEKDVAHMLKKYGKSAARPNPMLLSWAWA